MVCHLWFCLFLNSRELLNHKVYLSMMMIKMFILHLFEWQKERERESLAWARLTPEAGISIWSLMGRSSRGPSAWTTICCLPECSSTNLDCKRNSRTWTRHPDMGCGHPKRQLDLLCDNMSTKPPMSVVFKTVMIPWGPNHISNIQTMIYFCSHTPRGSIGCRKGWKRCFVDFERADVWMAENNLNFWAVVYIIVRVVCKFLSCIERIGKAEKCVLGLVVHVPLIKSWNLSTDQFPHL